MSLPRSTPTVFSAVTFSGWFVVPPPEVAARAEYAPPSWAMPSTSTMRSR